MNCIILFESDFDRDDRHVRLAGRRLTHVLDVLKARKDDTVTVGLLNGKLGAATVTVVDEHVLEMEVALDRDPPPPSQAALIMALPRPKSMRKALHAAVTMGIKTIHLINTWKVDKSYWQTPWLDPEYLRDLCILGLEQSVDTVMPQIRMHRLFRPFAEDELSGLIGNTRAILAHPGAANVCPYNIGVPFTLGIGPEGGFTDYEVEMMVKKGFEPVTFGDRILRVEEAVAALIGRLL